MTVETQIAADPHLWLEDWDGPEVMAWVDRENRKTNARLEDDPLYPVLFGDALALASASDRIVSPSRLMGRIYNFWRDGDHPQGLWRWTTPESYATDRPDWSVALDLDALSARQGRKWVWKGAQALHGEERLCLISLSDGGEDAIEVHEFDLETQAFVEGGFVLPRGKQGAVWLDRDRLLVSRDWGEADDLSTSGYPLVVRLWQRGTPLADAREIHRGAPEDQLGTYASVTHDAQGNRAVFIVRRPTFFTGESWLWDEEAGKIRLDIPERAFPAALFDGRMVFTTDCDWQEGVAAGSLAWAPLTEVATGRFVVRPLFVPGPRQALGYLARTQSRLMVLYTDNVRSRIDVLRTTAQGWEGHTLPLPDNLSIDVASSSQKDDVVYLTLSGFVTPTTLVRMEATDPRAVLHRVQATPARFDATGLAAHQFEAISSDGTAIPYFLVYRPDARGHGGAPTMMTAYGGFQVPMMPAYSGMTGKLWLERGGQFVVANIRGGGEFGPAWHEAGRKTKRQTIYDDFYAVARDLIARGFTTAAQLGIVGGSNGGLLMGVAMTQQPSLWNAVTIQVPLLDMLRYERIAAGPSWVDEFGSVAVPEERDFLARISPYHQLRAGVAYPEPFIWTTTKDDRVGPQHARKFAARMGELGLPYLFHEDTQGGHSGDSDVAQMARIQALQTVYFARKLGLESDDA